VQIIRALRKLAVIATLLGGVAMQAGNSFALDRRGETGASISFLLCDMVYLYWQGL
jgi:hypothetical protein